ncbi:MAG: protein-L-isoaspartate(D-aspartate) O-methyltransferase [Schleiferiaceae bacterium]|jgi:protein-L-isoaspartate(D-aspartate) O-methyltransferase|nr:protein-L-isoaspartate(D-aspartate) O-methyltransferase [Schleiferiaceae bacterium]MDP4758932.1 protein-L-isoaspartate(D-aspartate) O-methyltransferase [Schleiferiaceae bacterium]MDP4767018.1 protein-L-isoaspartate(D-aspartate) O-methyltransferase [Schleiferiaceae bacterium]MDP4876764.1 protein-L-isoaspartate(D-aspartate) O-methyltransferase [Schleiferiaceae bacterium]MDP4959006.1 protein-L-isoaspartate(D-aspartate) O-methyltransferase [Schleiferiaceae bacterium]
MQNQDSPYYQGQRAIMCSALKAKGLAGDAVLNAMNRIPRHLFLESSFHQHAYQDKAFPIAADQTISHPSTVAWQSELLELRPGMKVLEIGTGSGYQAAVLCELGMKLFSIERQKALFDFSKKMLSTLGYRAELKFGDGFKGMPVFAPFDRVIVTCGAPFVPKALLAQLIEGGIMIIPVGEGTQKMVKITKQSDGSFVQKVLGDAAFVPMLKDRE